MKQVIFVCNDQTDFDSGYHNQPRRRKVLFYHSTWTLAVNKQAKLQQSGSLEGVFQSTNGLFMHLRTSVEG